mgnify:CR=1 FL=1
MSQGYKKTFEDLTAKAVDQGAKSDELYVLKTKPHYGSAEDAKAADGADTIDAACFYLTHAYIFALELGRPEVQALHARLDAHGRV